MRRSLAFMNSEVPKVFLLSQSVHGSNTTEHTGACTCLFKNILVLSIKRCVNYPDSELRTVTF